MITFPLLRTKRFPHALRVAVMCIVGLPIAFAGTQDAAKALQTSPTDAGSSTPSPAPTLQSHFRAIWAADRCVQENGQTWPDYVSWVQRFYGGSFGTPGWLDTTKSALAKITDPAARETIRRQFGVLGIAIAGEWSKTNACRKIRTSPMFNSDEAGKPAVSDWGSQLERAVDADSGDGSVIGATVKRIQRQVDVLLKNGP